MKALPLQGSWACQVPLLSPNTYSTDFRSLLPLVQLAVWAGDPAQAAAHYTGRPLPVAYAALTHTGLGVMGVLRHHVRMAHEMLL